MILFHYARYLWAVALIFEPRDLWRGVYWKWTSDTVADNGLTLYICIVPMLPIRVHLADRERRRQHRKAQRLYVP